MRGRLGQITGNLRFTPRPFHQRVPNLKPDGFQFTAHLMIPKPQHLDSLGREEFISLFILGALVGKSMSAAVEFHRELGGGAVEIQKVRTAGVLAMEFEFAETSVAQKSP